MSSKKLHLVFNSKSGRGQGPTLKSLAEKICAANGWELIPHEISDPKQIENIMRETVTAVEADGGTLAAAGGDGALP